MLKNNTLNRIEGNTLVDDDSSSTCTIESYRELNNKLIKITNDVIIPDPKLIKLKSNVDAENIIKVLVNFFDLNKNSKVSNKNSKGSKDKNNLNIVELLNSKQLTITYCYTFIENFASNLNNKKVYRKQFIIVRFCIDKIVNYLTLNHIISFFKEELLRNYICRLFTSDIKFEYLRIENDERTVDTGKIMLRNYYGDLSTDYYETSINPYQFKMNTVNKVELKKQIQFLKLYGVPKSLKDITNPFKTNKELEINIFQFKNIFTNFIYCYSRNMVNESEKQTGNYNWKIKLRHWTQKAINTEDSPLFRVKCVGIHRKALFTILDTDVINCEMCIEQSFRD